MVKKITALQNLDTSSFKQKINLLTEKKMFKDDIYHDTPTKGDVEAVSFTLY